MTINKPILYILLMGALGSLSRYGLSLWMGSPQGTFAVNVVGCFLLPIIFDYLAVSGKCSEDFAFALGTGFIGSFTTFSAFSGENAELLLAGSYGEALAYISASLIGGFVSTLIGLAVAKRLPGRRGKV